MKKPRVDTRRHIKLARLSRRKIRVAKGQKKRNWLLQRSDSTGRYYTRSGTVTPFTGTRPTWPGLMKSNSLKQYAISIGAGGKTVRTFNARSKYTPQTAGHR